MNTFVWLGVAVLSLFAAAAWLAVWSRKDSWARPVAVALLVLGVLVIPAAGLQSLGHHRPLPLAWELTPGDHRVLAAKLVQDVAIYLYLDDPARAEPWPLVLPWNNAMADKIQKMQDGAEGDAKGQFLMRFKPSLDFNAPQFHAIPQPPMMPEKPRQEPVPHLGQDV